MGLRLNDPATFLSSPLAALAATFCMSVSRSRVGGEEKPCSAMHNSSEESERDRFPTRQNYTAWVEEHQAGQRAEAGGCT